MEAQNEVKDTSSVEEKEFHRDGPHVGNWITRSVLDERGFVSSLSIGNVVGYLGPSESDFIDDNGEACGLWKVEYVSGELEGDSEDLEEWELLASAMRPSRELTEAASLEAGDNKGQQRTYKKRSKKRRSTATLIPERNGVLSHEEEDEVREESEYERQRRERIEANEAFLRELGLSSKKERDQQVAQQKKRKQSQPQIIQSQESDLRRSSRRCVVETINEKSRYNEDRAYKEACEAAERDARMELERRKEFRLQKEAERKREIQAKKIDERIRKEERRRDDAMQAEINLLRRRVIALERELSKKTAADRQAARILEKPNWLKSAGFDWSQLHPGGLGTFSFESHTLVDDIQIGDRFYYFVDGHLEYLKNRGIDNIEKDEIVPTFLNEAPAEYRVLQVIISQVLPCFPEFGEYVDARLDALQDAHPSIFTWFQRPVDIEQYPEYARLIKTPMDFSTIYATRYETMEAFRDDIMLIFSNALQFNLHDSEIAQAAMKLRQTFLEQDEWPLDAFFAEQTPFSIHNEPKKSTTKKKRQRRTLENNDDMPVQFAPPIQQRLLVRLVPTFYVTKTHFDDPQQDNDGEAANNNLQYLSYYSRKGNKGNVIIEPWTVWLTDDIDFLVPVQLVQRCLKPLSELPSFALGFDNKRYTLRSVQAAHPKLKTQITRWRGLELQQIDSSTIIWKNVWEIMTFGDERDILTNSPHERRASSRLRKIQLENDDISEEKTKKSTTSTWTYIPSSNSLIDNDFFFGDFSAEEIDQVSDTLIRVIDAVAEVSDISEPLFGGPSDESRSKKEFLDQDGDEILDIDTEKTDKNNPMNPILQNTLQAPLIISLSTIRSKLRNRVYRRPSAIYDDIRRIYLFTAATCYYSFDDKRLIPNALEKFVFKAKLASQLLVALFANELSAETAKKVTFTPVSPWQTFIRKNQDLKNKAGIMIRENCKLAITAARRDLSHDIVRVRCVIAEIRQALLVVRTNAAGLCRDKSLATLDIYGGWHLGADATRAQDTVAFIKEGPKIVASLVTNRDQMMPGAIENLYSIKSANAPDQKPIRIPNLKIGDHVIRRSAPASNDFVFGTVEGINLTSVPRKATVRYPGEDPIVISLKQASDGRIQYLTPPQSIHDRIFAHSNTIQPPTEEEDSLDDNDEQNETPPENEFVVPLGPDFVPEFVPLGPPAALGPPPTETYVSKNEIMPNRKKQRLNSTEIRAHNPGFKKKSSANPHEPSPKMLVLRLATTRILCARDADDFRSVVHAFDFGTKVAPVTKGGNRAATTTKKSSSATTASPTAKKTKRSSPRRR